MTQPRHTADSITSDALDALYEQLDTAQQTELARQLATCDKAFASATLRAARAEARAYKAEAALNAVRQLHVRNEHTGTCEECSRRDYPDYSVPAPCPTIRALDAHNTSGESR